MQLVMKDGRVVSYKQWEKVYCAGDELRIGGEYFVCKETIERADGSRCYIFHEESEGLF